MYLDWLVDLNFHGTNTIFALLIPSETDRNIQNKSGFIVLTRVVAGWKFTWQLSKLIDLKGSETQRNRT